MLHNQEGRVLYQRPFGLIGKSWIEAERFDTPMNALNGVKVSMGWYVEVREIPA